MVDPTELEAQHKRRMVLSGILEDGLTRVFRAKLSSLASNPLPTPRLEASSSIFKMPPTQCGLVTQPDNRNAEAPNCQDDQILPPVPPSLAARGIVLQKGKDGTLQYMCQKQPGAFQGFRVLGFGLSILPAVLLGPQPRCKAGPFPTLDRRWVAVAQVLSRPRSSSSRWW